MVQERLSRLLKSLIETGGNITLRVVKTTRWQRERGEELLRLITGRKAVEERVYFPPPPEEAQVIARWDVGEFDSGKWG